MCLWDQITYFPGHLLSDGSSRRTSSPVDVSEWYLGWLICSNNIGKVKDFA